jgi:isopenicillin N synthase-like dioxygenase
MTLSTDRIPTIDVSSRNDSTVSAIGHAAEIYGFMLIRGHGIAPSVLEDAFEAGRCFFALPETEKRRMKDIRSDRGFHPMFDNLREDGKPSGQEGYTMGHPVPLVDSSLASLPFYAPTPWPDIAGFRTAFETLYASLFALGRLLLGTMAEHLGAPERFFDAALTDTYSHMRINHYPPHEAVAHVAEEGVFAHFDESLLTLLLQDLNSGLQVMGRDGLWIPVEPDPTAVVVNVGKMLRHWTGGRYNAALHQVINHSGRDRYSIPLFMHPSFRTVIDPRALVGRDVEGYPPIVAGETVYAAFATSRQSWKDEAERSTGQPA